MIIKIIGGVLIGLCFATMYFLGPFYGDYDEDE